MIQLILWFLIFNLSLITNTLSTTTLSPILCDQNKNLSTLKHHPLNSDERTKKLDIIKKDNVIQQQYVKKETISLRPVSLALNQTKKIPRQFALQKPIELIKPAKIEEQVFLINPNDPKKPFCIHCRPKRSFFIDEVTLINETKETKIPNIISKHWNNNSELVPTKPKKRVLVFMSKGGGGHISVSNALKSYLEDGYEVTIANFFEDVMSPVDTVRSLTFGKASGEDIYNFCLQNRFISLINGFTKFGAWSLRQKSTSIEPLIENFIIQHKPDLIISVIPVVNFILLSAAKKFEIPFLIVTNDLDTANYINGISKIDYNKFYYTVAFNDKDIFDKFKAAQIPKSQITITGFPLRPDFYDKNKNKTVIKKDFQIPSNKKVVMILMGGAGSFVCYRYVQALARSKKTMHIIACIGRDERLREAISGIKLPSYISLSIVGFTSRISDLMAVSDLLITKAGPNSICEAVSSGLPLLIDQTTGNIWWEVMNVDFVKKNQIGDTITRFKEISTKITKFLDDIKYVQSVKSRMKKIQAGIDFRQRIRCLIDRITN